MINVYFVIILLYFAIYKYIYIYIKIKLIYLYKFNRIDKVTKLQIK